MKISQQDNQVLTGDIFPIEIHFHFMSMKCGFGKVSNFMLTPYSFYFVLRHLTINLYKGIMIIYNWENWQGVVISRQQTQNSKQVVRALHLFSSSKNLKSLTCICYYEGGSKSPCNHLFSLHMGAFIQRWQCLHQV